MRFKSEWLFYVGVALLPFENFYFAPSAGWGTLSPLFFAAYVALNYKLISRYIVRYWKIFAFFIAAVILGSITAFIYQVPVKSYIDSFVPLALGATSLLSFSIYYGKTHKLSNIANILVVSYGICAMLGIFEFLAIKLDNYPVVNFLKEISKRNYIGLDRVQFFFTEPSFVGMHLFGVLLPLYWLTRRKDVAFILVLFAAEAVLLQTGVRVAIDIAVVAILYFVFIILKHNKAKFIPLILLILGMGAFYVYDSNVRVQNIVKEGVYADGSLATRYFRMQSSLIGYRNTAPNFLLGYGLGNSMYPIRSGYEEAYEQYNNDYTKEIDELGGINESDDAASYSLYTRMISEFGLIMTIIAFTYLVIITDRSRFPQKWLYFSIILYLYVQFESLGFYAIWLFIIIMTYTKGDLTFAERFKLKHNIKSPKAKKKVLVFGMTDKSGGVESVIMNYYRNIDRNNIQFDFLCNTEKVAYEDEIKKLGGKIYRVPARSKDRKAFNVALKSFFKKHADEYDSFWMNVCSLANIDYLRYAKKYGISKRIIHAHNSKNMDSKLRGMLHIINRINIDDYATDFWTCSDSSSKWFYPELRSHRIKKIKNAFDLDKFKFNEKKREAFRKKHHLTNSQKAIVNVGRLNFQKNQEFIIKLSESINAEFFLIGTGEDAEKLKSEVKAKGLDEKVHILGEQKDIKEILSGGDLFLFPSLFEGSPVALYEAEASGIATVASKESYTESRKLSKTVSLLSLKKSDADWKKLIDDKLSEKSDRKKASEDNIENLRKAGFDIKKEAKNLEDILL